MGLRLNCRSPRAPDVLPLPARLVVHMDSPATPRPAATVILLRDGPEGPEVWLMERSRSVGFMASAWVFPGGRVDEADASLAASKTPDDAIPRAFWTAAARELEEEAGVRLGDSGGYHLHTMRPWSHWITPEVESRRYDTWFFVARLPEGALAVHDGGEAVAGEWFRPSAAIERYSMGELALAPPTLRTLTELTAFENVEAVLAAPRRTPPIMPTFEFEGERVWVLLPGDPAHPSPDAVDPPFRYEFSAGRWWKR